MINSIYLNKTGMIIQQRRLDVSTNNLANINTVGYKKDGVFFHKLAEALADTGEADANRLPGSSNVDFSLGTMQRTDNPLDVAINGEGFFVIQGEDGEYFSRNGSFQLDGEGRLVTIDGHSVVTDGGEIQIAGGEVRFNEKGEIIVDGQSVGRLRIATFEDPQQLERIGDAYFKAGTAGATDLPNEEIDLRAGYLELSNVDPVMEMVNMIEINREYELGQKVINTQDNTLDKLINQTGRP
ncbi:MAG: flagellar basal-body rod protein FlgF [Calditrichia bacterium]|nr:flagellar basal-body rod protein FlgF [Calditrichota bacterium]MCB0267592.1 flagellar basal-body rod protein FlgF [Calditrichota bacterium]MCB9067997.1 flagellar basal-body rod protein FlgF [Calditrichia bacterium]